MKGPLPQEVAAFFAPRPTFRWDLQRTLSKEYNGLPRREGQNGR